MLMAMLLACTTQPAEFTQQPQAQPQPQNQAQFQLAPQGAGNRPEPQITAIHYYDRMEKTDGFSEVGIQCRLTEKKLQCRRYESSHPIDPNTMQGKWHDVSNPQDTRPLLQSVSLHQSLNKALRQQYGVGDKKDHDMQGQQPAKQAAKFLPGAGQNIVFNWKEYDVFFPIQDGATISSKVSPTGTKKAKKKTYCPPDKMKECDAQKQEANAKLEHVDYSEPRDDMINRIKTWLEKSVSALPVLQPKFMLLSNKKNTLPLKKPAFLDDVHTVTMLKCGKKSIDVGLYKNGKKIKAKKISQKTLEWKILDYTLRDFSWDCQDSKTVSFSVRAG